MTRSSTILCLAVLTLISAGMSGQERANPSPSHTPSLAAGDWPHYTADIKGTKYSPLAQIDATNFNKLEVAWRFKTDMLGPRPEYKLEGTPLAVNGVLYTTGGTRRSVDRPRREDRRADVGAQPARREARRHRAAPTLGPRRLVLDRRPRRRSRPVRHHRLSPRRAQRAHRRADQFVRHQTASST